MKVLVPTGSLIRFVLWVTVLSTLAGFTIGSREIAPGGTPTPGTSDDVRLTSTGRVLETSTPRGLPSATDLPGHIGRASDAKPQPHN